MMSGCTAVHGVFSNGPQILSGSPGLFSGITEDPQGRRWISTGSGGGPVLVFFLALCALVVIFTTVSWVLMPFVFMLFRRPGAARKSAVKTWNQFIRDWFCTAQDTLEWSLLSEINVWEILLEPTRRKLVAREAYSERKRKIIKQIASEFWHTNFGVKDTSVEPCTDRIVRVHSRLLVPMKNDYGRNQDTLEWSLLSGSEKFIASPIIVATGEIGRIGHSWYVASWRISWEKSGAVVDELQLAEADARDAPIPPKGFPYRNFT